MEFERPVIKLDSVVLDCPDPKKLADFYEKLLGWKRLSSEKVGMRCPLRTARSAFIFSSSRIMCRLYGRQVRTVSR